MLVKSGVGFAVRLPGCDKTIGEGRMGGAGGVPTVGRVVLGVIVLARLEDTLARLLMGAVPVHGLPRGFGRERMTRGHRQKQTRANGAKEPQLSVPVNIAAACSWPWRMLCSAACWSVCV